MLVQLHRNVTGSAELMTGAHIEVDVLGELEVVGIHAEVVHNE